MASRAAGLALLLAPEYPTDFTRCTNDGAIGPSSGNGGDWLTTNKDFQQRIAAPAGDMTSPAGDESKIGAGLRTICEGQRIGIDTSPFRRWKRGDESQRRGRGGSSCRAGSGEGPRRFYGRNLRQKIWRRDDYVSQSFRGSHPLGRRGYRPRRNGLSVRLHQVRERR